MGEAVFVGDVVRLRKAVKSPVGVVHEVSKESVSVVWDIGGSFRFKRQKEVVRFQKGEACSLPLEDVEVIDRELIPGDVVGYSGRIGIVRDAKMAAEVASMAPTRKRRLVTLPCRRLCHVQPFLPGAWVRKGQWVGRVKAITEKVIVVTHGRDVDSGSNSVKKWSILEPTKDELLPLQPDWVHTLQEKKERSETAEMVGFVFAPGGGEENEVSKGSSAMIEREKGVEKKKKRPNAVLLNASDKIGVNVPSLSSRPHSPPYQHPSAVDEHENKLVKAEETWGGDVDDALCPGMQVMVNLCAPAVKPFQEGKVKSGDKDDKAAKSGAENGEKGAVWMPSIVIAVLPVAINVDWVGNAWHIGTSKEKDEAESLFARAEEALMKGEDYFEAQLEQSLRMGLEGGNLEQQQPRAWCSPSSLHAFHGCSHLMHRAGDIALVTEQEGEARRGENGGNTSASLSSLFGTTMKTLRIDGGPHLLPFHPVKVHSTTRMLTVQWQDGDVSTINSKVVRPVQRTEGMFFPSEYVEVKGSDRVMCISAVNSSRGVAFVGDSFSRTIESIPLDHLQWLSVLSFRHGDIVRVHRRHMEASIGEVAGWEDGKYIIQLEAGLLRQYRPDELEPVSAFADSAHSGEEREQQRKGSSMEEEVDAKSYADGREGGRSAGHIHLQEVASERDMLLSGRENQASVSSERLDEDMHELAAPDTSSMKTGSRGGESSAIVLEASAFGAWRGRRHSDREEEEQQLRKLSMSASMDSDSGSFFHAFEKLRIDEAAIARARFHLGEKEVEATTCSPPLSPPPPLPSLVPLEERVDIADIVDKYKSTQIRPLVGLQSILVDFQSHCVKAKVLINPYLMFRGGSTPIFEQIAVRGKKAESQPGPCPSPSCWPFPPSLVPLFANEDHARAFSSLCYRWVPLSSLQSPLRRPRSALRRKTRPTASSSPLSGISHELLYDLSDASDCSSPRWR